MGLDAIQPIRRVFKTSYLVLLVGALLSLPGWPVEGYWKSIGPEGGDFAGAIVNATNEMEVTVFTFNPPSVFRSRDGGANWNKLNDLPDSNLYDIYAYDSSIVYALCYGAVCRSSDGGETWTKNTYSTQNGYAQQIICHPTDSNTIFGVGSYDAYQNGVVTSKLTFMKSTDGGRRWQIRNHLSFDYFSVYHFALSVKNPSVMYITGYKEDNQNYSTVVLRTVDGGQSWNDVTPKLGENKYESFYGVAIDPGDENRVYLSGTFFYTSQDGGVSWERGNDPVNSYTLYFDPTNPRRLFAGGYNGLLYSTDRGSHWQSYLDVQNPIRGQCNRFIVAPSNPSTIYLCTNQAFYKTVDGGNTWKPAQKGIFNTVIAAMDISPSNPKTLYAEQQFYQELVSQDGGNTWNLMPPFQSSGSLVSLQVHPENPQQLIALEQYGYPECITFRSIDAGNHWEIVDSFFARGSCLAQDPKNSNVIYAGGIAAVSDEYKIAIAKSEDGGATWNTRFYLPTKPTRDKYNISCRWIAVSRGNPRIIFVAATEENQALIFRTDNGGGVWKNVSNNLMAVHTQYAFYSETYTVLCLPTNEYTLLAGTLEGIFISTNGGNVWKKTNVSRATNAFAYDSVQNRLYAATEDGVYYSESGSRWQFLGSGLRGVNCRCLAINPLDGTLYVGTNGSGVWRYSYSVGVDDWSVY